MARVGDKQTAQGALMCKHEEERLLSKHGRRWEDNIKIALKEIGSFGALTGLF